jgi:putative spermidine/putrescine transport system ATP-binding protein
MADRVAVMSRGRIEQVSTPTEIYDEPKTLFVNEFVGTANIVSGNFVREGRVCRVMLANGVGVDVRSKVAFSDGSRVAVSIRPEQLRFVSEGGLAGTVKVVMPLGAQVVYEIEVTPDLSLKVSEAREGKAVTRRSGEKVRVAPMSTDACHLFPIS